MRSNTQSLFHVRRRFIDKLSRDRRIKAVLNEIEKSEVQVLLFIDELHLIMAGQGAQGGGMDAANLIKPMLARGKLRCIGATTL